MPSQRDQEMQRGGPRDAERARGMTFDCPACKRPAECPGLPTVAEDGHTRLSDSEVREVYNLRRYEHYLRDFVNDEELREHLVDRAHYWAVDDQKLLADFLAANDATIAWWRIAHRRQVEGQQRTQERLVAP
jgi:hypothetical protein